MARPVLELADIFRRHGAAYRESHKLTPPRQRAMRAIELCRTAPLGGHVDACDSCEYEHISYNSCRNRHCPKCQSLASAKWIDDRKAELLPVPYFHVVFTIPDKLNGLVMQNQKAVFGRLFRAVADTLLAIGADRKHLGAKLGFFGILHTWSQTLLFHPHIHCVVPGGGLSADGKWVSCRKGFFLSVRVLSRLFRRLFLESLRVAYDKGELEFHGQQACFAEKTAFEELLRQCLTTEWVVYAKEPFAGPEQVLAYLARYTHRIAISNHRLLSFKDGKVTLRWKDYRDGDRQKTMTLDADEFIRRFLMHVVPNGFVRIRYFGWMANRVRAESLARCREALEVTVDAPADEAQRGESPEEDWQARYEKLTGTDLRICPHCKTGRIIRSPWQPRWNDSS